MRPWGKDNLAYIYTLFEIDAPREDYALANVLLQEYVHTVTDGNYERKSSKDKRKSKRSTKDKSSRSKRRSGKDGEIDWKSIDAW